MTDYNKISHTTTGYDTIGVDAPLHGYGIMVDEQLLYVDNQDYHVDGSIVYRDTLGHEPEIRCDSAVIFCDDSWTVDCAGHKIYIKDGSDV